MTEEFTSPLIHQEIQQSEQDEQLLQRRRVLGDHRHNAAAPDVRTRTQMGKHLVCGPISSGEKMS